MYVLEENDYWDFLIFCWAMEEWDGMEWYYFVLYRVISYIHTRMPLGENKKKKKKKKKRNAIAFDGW